MKPSDVRDSVWVKGRAAFRQDCEKVYEAVQKHGPGTTRELAGRSGLSLLTLRPRVTELHKAFLVELTGKKHGEGIYRARTWEEAERLYREACIQTPEQQADLPFKEAV